MSSVIFELKDVYFSYLGRFPALSGVNMTIRSGETVAVIGSNGTGKSTLMHLLDGLIFADKGRVTALGRELNEDSFSDEVAALDFRRHIGLLFQNPDIQLFCPTLRDDIAFGPLQLGIKEAEVTKRLESVAEALGIGHLLDRVPHQLSVGEKRKAALASVLAIRPEVIILDEPTAGLDPSTIRQVIDLVIQLSEAGKTIVMATHDLHLVEAVADIVYVFSLEKRIVRSGRPEDILTDSRFLEENNLIHAHSHRHQGKIHFHPHQHFEHHH